MKIIHPENKKKINFYYVRFILIGSLASTSLPPLSIFPLIFLLSIPIFYFCESQNSKKAFLIGFFTALGWFLASLYWLSNSLVIGGKQFIWMIPFVFFGFPAFLSIFWGLAFYISNIFGKSFVEKMILISIFFPVFEWLRGNILTGFPWNMLGFALSHPLEISQTVSLMGPYGQNTLAILIVLIPVSLVAKQKSFAITTTLFCCTVLFFSYYQFKTNKVIFTEHTVRLVQPNFSHSEKWERNKFYQNLNKLVELSNADFSESGLIVWPETALTNFEENISKEINIISRSILLNDKAYLISGIPSKEYVNDTMHYYNSVMVFNHKGDNIGKYDKNKLVPFGEYIPFRKGISFLKILASDKEFSKGSIGAHFFKFGNLNIYPMICYEAVFPWKKNKRTSYDLIVNITNDNWFGNTFGPAQHFWLSKQRVIETGIPMIRVSNSGISAVIAPNGKEIGKLNYGISGFLDTKIPKKFSETFYSKWGDSIFFLMTIILIIVYCILRLNTKQKKIINN